MIQHHNNATIYQQIKQEFRSLGYTHGLLYENYEFTDILSPNLPIKEIQLATFSQEPTSYYSACFGVVSANDKSGIPLVSEYRSLGAPQILEITSDGLRRWGITSAGQPQFIDEVDADNILALFDRHRNEWTPDNFNRARSASKEAMYQLDFLDMGLLPLLDHEVQTKLDKLLNRTISEALEILQPRFTSPDDYLAPLLRLVFRLIAAKILSDRQHPGQWLYDDPRRVVKEVENFYFKKEKHLPVLLDYDAQVAVWNGIREAFHFQNLSVEALAYVYENTLITKETRKRMGTYGTAPAFAEYIVRHLPFEDLALDERRIFEPFSGHAVFLVAALRRLRELLPSTMSLNERHNYFIDMLSGLELDAFAREVGKLSLMLADYPNPDGWHLYDGDAFESERLDRELTRANVVLCNPPFEDFKPDEMMAYEHLTSIHKPAAILGKVLQYTPKMLGFVLPRVFTSGNGYRYLRNSLGNTYSSIEVVGLPDTAFEHSEAETVLLIASGNKTNKVNLIVSEVYKKSLNSFKATHKPSHVSRKEISVGPSIFSEQMWLPVLEGVWEATASLPRLSTIADVHRGIEYNIPFKENRHLLVSKEEHPFFKPGLHRVEDGLEVFLVTNRVYLNTDESLMRTGAITLPWEKPKLILNASRRTRGHWKITAAPDYDGLYCYQTFMGVWPRNELSIQFLCAVLNSPVANAFIACHEGQRSIRGETIKGIPIPDIAKADIDQIQKLVNEYAYIRQRWLRNIFSDDTQLLCKALIEKIDAEILKAYDLTPRLERSVLDYFTGHRRPVPVEFIEYYPEDFKPFIPWHLYTSGALERAAAGATLRRLRVIDDPIVTSALSNLE